MEIKHVKASEFNNEVLKSDKPVLVDFWADWCGPCKMLGPVLEQVAAKVDDVQIVKINVDEESSVAEKYNIMSDRKSTRLNSSHRSQSRMPSSA